MEAPGFDEHRSGRNAWAIRLADEELQAYNPPTSTRPARILLGRTTYLIWAAFWPQIATRATRFGRRINAASQVRGVEVARPRRLGRTRRTCAAMPRARSRELKARWPARSSCQRQRRRVAGILAAGLVDEYRILVYPVILGSGKRLFRDEAAWTYLRLTSRGLRQRRRAARLRALVGRAPASEYTTRRTPGPTSSAPPCMPPQDTDRVLATVLFTDIVNSTGHAAALGDRAVAAAPRPARPGHPGQDRALARHAREVDRRRGPRDGSTHPLGRCAARSGCAPGSRRSGWTVRVGRTHR